MVKEKNSDLYQIDEILDHRHTSRGREYLVKWLNYTHEANSWEPAKNFYSHKMIEVYHKRHNLKPNTKNVARTKKNRNTRYENTTAAATIITDPDFEKRAADEVGEEAADMDEASTERPPNKCRTFIDLLPNENYSAGGELLRMVDLHLRRDEGQMALVQFKQQLQDEQLYTFEYVPIDWMNVNHPQKVIRFYESRVFFRNKQTGSVEKCCAN